MLVPVLVRDPLPSWGPEPVPPPWLPQAPPEGQKQEADLKEHLTPRPRQMEKNRVRESPLKLAES